MVEFVIQTKKQSWEIVTGFRYKFKGEHKSVCADSELYFPRSDSMSSWTAKWLIQNTTKTVSNYLKPFCQRRWDFQAFIEKKTMS